MLYEWQSNAPYSEIGTFLTNALQTIVTLDQSDSFDIHHLLTCAHLDSTQIKTDDKTSE